ncbi:MAG TPA: DUF2027 domain-containing protein, partial [Bacteroidia bacterium]|nr:DUF2027 domain-containing protein [Bacteroidia bacterium]
PSPYICTMIFHKGDKVRFLNETGSGVVTKIMGNGMVMVEIEDGFEYPYPAKELVHSEPSINSPGGTKDKGQVTGENNSEKKSINTPDSQLLTPNYPDGIYLAFIPKHQQFPSAGEIQLVLFNHSDYDIYYTLSLKDGRDWICIQSGALGPRRQVEIDTLTPQAIDEWGTIKTDLIFFSEEAYEHRQPVSDQLRLKGVKFFKDSTYTQDLLVGKRAYVSEIEILEADVQAESERPFINNDDIKRMLEAKEKNKSDKKTSTPHLKNQVLEKEIDLHIEELLDNWSGMTNAQLIDVQLKKMQKELDEAIANHYQRIIFIHGVGNGRLKSEVRRILAGYKGIRFHDASLQRYGFGATEVLLY